MVFDLTDKGGRGARKDRAQVPTQDEFVTIPVFGSPDKSMIVRRRTAVADVRNLDLEKKFLEESKEFMAETNYSRTNRYKHDHSYKTKKRKWVQFLTVCVTRADTQEMREYTALIAAATIYQKFGDPTYLVAQTQRALLFENFLGLTIIESRTPVKHSDGELRLNGIARSKKNALGIKQMMAGATTESYSFLNSNGGVTGLAREPGKDIFSDLLKGSIYWALHFNGDLASTNANYNGGPYRRDTYRETRSYVRDVPLLAASYGTKGERKVPEELPSVAVASRGTQPVRNSNGTRPVRKVYSQPSLPPTVRPPGSTTMPEGLTGDPSAFVSLNELPIAPVSGSSTPLRPESTSPESTVESLSFAIFPPKGFLKAVADRLKRPSKRSED